MFRLFAACLLAFAVAGLPQTIRAQESSQQSAETLPPIEPAHLELARQAFTASKAGRNFDEILPVVADRAKATFVQANPQMQLGIIDVVDRVALEMVSERKRLDEDLSKVWARAFEPAELEQILAFYNSPAGQKFANQYQRILETQLAVADHWTREIGNEMARRVTRELRKMRNQDIKQLRGTSTEGQNQ